MISNTSNSFSKDLFNIDLILNFDPKTKFIKEITTSQTMETSSNVFHKEGLFSNEIFGLPGTPIRSTQLAYINLRIPVLHPLVYQQYCKLRALYKDIMDGKTYVVFDNKEGDFVISNPTEGSTGYEYFIQHVDKLKLSDRDSDRRKIRLDLINKYGKSNNLLQYWLVMPAGLRDYSVDEDGRPNENEINTLYRKLISVSTMLSSFKITPKDYYLYDKIRLKIQKTLLEIYEYIVSMLDGKSKFIQGKWAKRAVMYGTRNVISPFTPNIHNLNDTHSPSINHTIIGLYQYLKSILPVTTNRFINNVTNRVFTNDVNEARVLDIESKKYKIKQIDIKIKEKWFTMDGVNDLLEKLRYDDTILQPVKLDKDYLFYIYDNNNSITIIRDNDDIKEDMDYNKLRPITYGELFYIACYDILGKYPGFVTRYPVTGLGSIYPSYTYVKSTVKGRKVKLIDKLINIDMIEYPILKEKWYRSMAPNTNRIKLLGADFDGRKDCY